MPLVVDFWKEHAPCEIGNHEWSAWTDPKDAAKEVGYEGFKKQTKYCIRCNKARTRHFH